MQAQFQLLKLLAICLGNFAGDTGGRFLVDFGGRNTYAGAQLALCLFGAHTVAGSLSSALSFPILGLGSPKQTQLH